MYKPKYFAAHEVVPPHIYKQRKNSSFLMMDERILKAADILREQFGPAYINTYNLKNSPYGRGFKWSGLRDELFKKEMQGKKFSKFSDHFYGRALDLKFPKTSPKKVRKWIKLHKDFYVPDPKNSTLITIQEVITCVEEDTPTWVHISCRNVKPIQWIKP
jgi:hypothetical protein